MALATSDASARVGRGFSIIDEGELHPQVAARHHDGVGGLHDGLDVLERDVLLDLGHHVHVPGDQRPQPLDVLGAAHEAQGHGVEVVLHGEGQVGPVLLGERRRRHRDAGQVHPLVAGEASAMHDPG
jgi:hypothetical protein